MTNRIHLACAFIVSLTALSCDDDSTADVNGGDTCNCPTPAAGETTYDNTGSRLAGSDVQDALDEFAARAEGRPDAHGRVQIVELSEAATSGSEEAGLTVACPTGTIALGGACDGGSIGNEVNLLATNLQSGGFSCVWRKPNEATPMLTAKATCLAPAE